MRRLVIFYFIFSLIYLSVFAHLFYRLRRGGGEGRFYEDQVTGAGGILANGFHFNTQRSPLSNAPPENSLG